jgi:rod shape-determining protein MreC
VHTPTKRIARLLIILFIFAIFIINSKSIASSVRVRLSDISSIPLKTIHAVFSAVKKVIPFASLREENRLLREKADLLTRELDETVMIREENERLKTLLDFRKSTAYATVPAQVIGRDPTNWSNSVIISKGLADGIKPNKAVVSARGLVGRVIEVGMRSSKILLITDPNSKVGALIQRDRQGGVIVGRPDGRCKMIYIALDSDVTTGDKVITAGFGSIFPKDILIGEVIKVGKEPGRLYKYAIVKTSADLSKLEEVLCIK